MSKRARFIIHSLFITLFMAAAPTYAAAGDDSGYTVTIEVPTGGTLTVKAGEEVIESGTKVAENTMLTVIPTPADGFYFRNWQYNIGAGWTHTLTVTFTVTVSHDISIRANFNSYPTVNFFDKNAIYKSVCLNSADEELGAYIDEVATPQNDNAHFPDFTFYGWTTDTTAAIPVPADASLTVTDNMRLFAVYTDGTHYCCELYSENVILDPDAVTALEIPEILNNNTTQFINKTTDVGGKSVRNFCLEYDKTRLHPRWVAYRFDGITRTIGDAVSRDDHFMDDPDLDADYRIGNNAFPGLTVGGITYDVDRGHLCASNDRLFTQQANDQTFYMTNMSPQLSRFNRGSWSVAEALVQDIGRDASFSDTLYVVKGGTIYGDDNTYGTMQRNGKAMTVPRYYFVALLQCKKNLDGDDGYKAIGLVADQMLTNVGWSDYDGQIGTEAHLVSIDALEQLTGIDFFHNLDDEIESRVERIDMTDDVADWWFTQTQTDGYPFVYNRTFDLQFNAFGLSTICLSYDAVVPDGVTAYTASLTDDDTVIRLTPCPDRVLPKNTGVLLQGTADTLRRFHEYHDGADGYHFNRFAGTTERIPAPEGTNYILTTRNGQCAFYRYTDPYLPAHTAYINIRSDRGTDMLSIDGMPTDIPTAHRHSQAGQAEYGISGVRHDGKPARGIIIRGGKKYYNQ